MDTVHGSRCAGPREAARRESDCEIYDSVCWPGSRLLQPVAGYRENRVYFSLQLCFDVSSTSRFVYVTSKSVSGISVKLCLFANVGQQRSISQGNHK